MRRPPDTSVGPLMDARDRRERFGAWITLAWLGLFALGVRIGIGYLPPVPEKDPFEGITLTKVNEQQRWRTSISPEGRSTMGVAILRGGRRITIRNRRFP